MLAALDWARERGGLLGVAFVCVTAIVCVFLWKLPELIDSIRELLNDLKDNNEAVRRGRARLMKADKKAGKKADKSKRKR